MLTRAHVGAAVPSGSIKRTTSQTSEAARASLARLARQTTEDINSRQTVPLPAEKVSPLAMTHEPRYSKQGSQDVWSLL